MLHNDPWKTDRMNIAVGQDNAKTPASGHLSGSVVMNVILFRGHIAQISGLMMRPVLR